jgi:hypothetical protein
MNEVNGGGVAEAEEAEEDLAKDMSDTGATVELRMKSPTSWTRTEATNDQRPGPNIGIIRVPRPRVIELIIIELIIIELRVSNVLYLLSNIKFRFDLKLIPLSEFPNRQSILAD